MTRLADLLSGALGEDCDESTLFENDFTRWMAGPCRDEFATMESFKALQDPLEQASAAARELIDHCRAGEAALAARSFRTFDRHCNELLSTFGVFSAEANAASYAHAA